MVLLVERKRNSVNGDLRKFLNVGGSLGKCKNGNGDWRERVCLTVFWYIGVHDVLRKRISVNVDLRKRITLISVFPDRTS